MKYIIPNRYRDKIQSTCDFLEANDFEILELGKVSVAFIFVRDHNSLYSDEMKNCIFQYINEKIPYIIICKNTQSSNIKINYLNSYLNLRIDISDDITDYEFVRQYIEDVTRTYKSLMGGKQVKKSSPEVLEASNSHTKLKIMKKPNAASALDQIIM